MGKKQNWSVDSAMQIVMNHKKPHQAQFQSVFDFSKIEVNEATLKQCLTYMAHLVDTHGDMYLPIFVRLKNELEKLKEKDALKRYAKQILMKDSNYNKDSFCTTNCTTKRTTRKLGKT